MKPTPKSRNSRISPIIAASLLALSLTMLGAGGPDGDKDAKDAKDGQDVIADKDDKGPRPAQREVRSGEQDLNPRILRARLQMRLEETRRLEVRLQESIARLDKGEGAQQVLRDVEGMRQDTRPDFKDPQKPLTEQERAELLTFIKEHMPRASARLVPGAEPEVTDRVLMRFAPRIRETLSLKQSAPKLFALRIDEMRATFDVVANARDLGAAVREKKTDGEISVIESGIKDAIGRRFDAQLAAQRHELESLGIRMDSLKAEIDRKSANRNAAVAEESAKTIERARKFDPAAPHRGREKGEKGEKGEKADRGQDPQGRQQPDPASGR